MTLTPIQFGEVDCLTLLDRMQKSFMRSSLPFLTRIRVIKQEGDVMCRTSVRKSFAILILRDCSICYFIPGLLSTLDKIHFSSLIEESNIDPRKVGDNHISIPPQRLALFSNPSVDRLALSRPRVLIVLVNYPSNPGRVILFMTNKIVLFTLISVGKFPGFGLR